MTDKELAVKYAPYLYFDKQEPFKIDNIGYSILRNTRKSPSFDRMIYVDKENVAFVIEYQLYYDYDIQHMYDLEHFWVYVDRDGNVCNGEVSAHGSCLNCYQYGRKVIEGTHIPVYVQPGKHAMLPEGNLFKLYSNYEIVCNKLAGVDGLLVPEMFKDMIIKDSYTDYLVCTYIRDHFSFQPSLEFYHEIYNIDIIVTWEELSIIIPKRINKLLDSLE
ncbi:MAG: hypothetical protein K0S61_632 [Anaerocolumna sp.]|nr:hypothetical protein [Anaerocolumna sp.]